ncbi:MAG: hypothetical protein IPN29_08790 [Saprospiraceae bacterium]|nr:hypothetical protein [Saprospiraceae bacterium]
MLPADLSNCRSQVDLRGSFFYIFCDKSSSPGIGHFVHKGIDVHAGAYRTKEQQVPGVDAVDALLDFNII